jgi:hypothetical protein
MVFFGSGGEGFEISSFGVFGDEGYCACVFVSSVVVPYCVASSMPVEVPSLQYVFGRLQAFFGQDCLHL